MTTSSIHFKRVDPFFCEKHNSRNTEKQPTYLLDKNLQKSNDFVKLADITVLHNEQLEIRKNNRCRGKAPELRDSCWEAVVNLEGRHSLEDMQPVLKLLQEKYHLTPTSVAIHRDEGYYDELHGTIKYNYHAHIPCYTVYQGKSVMRTIGKKQLSDMQTEVADLLGMQRGQINSTAKRLEQSEYRRLAKVKQELERAEQKQKQAEAVLSQVQPVLQKSVKEKEQLHGTVKSLNDEILSLKEQKALVEAERKRWKEAHDFVAEEYRKLQALNKSMFTKEQLNAELQKLRNEHEERISLQEGRIEYLEKAYQHALDDNTVLKNKNTELTQQRDNLIKFNSTVLQVIQAMYSDFDLEHPIQSLKKIYTDWKTQQQKSSITAPKRSITNENTVKRTEVQQPLQSQPMSVLERKSEVKEYELIINGTEYVMTAKEMKEAIADDTFSQKQIESALTAEQRAEVFGEPQQKQSLFSRVKHSLER